MNNNNYYYIVDHKTSTPLILSLFLSYQKKIYQFVYLNMACSIPRSPQIKGKTPKFILKLCNVKWKKRKINEALLLVMKSESLVHDVALILSLL